MKPHGEEDHELSCVGKNMTGLSCSSIVMHLTPSRGIAIAACIDPHPPPPCFFRILPFTNSAGLCWHRALEISRMFTSHICQNAAVDACALGKAWRSAAPLLESRRISEEGWWAKVCFWGWWVKAKWGQGA